ncbi:SpvB/TcaC N-terminal domain-containing protein [Flavitalea sp. BT771]|uniref:SpvB/TcaC N-terminal domain-containing protein n=1 Tax=Flavitalea sp. BT771 TaxID=3063329 RepID=UPI0026E32ECB|nr:SpvB/TcaC N-terminal domain-containing protein [Flavitalea sp. BT771]MDO6433174.1 SpvB/TcaC N-terminal domain-containing protein [Flavitalea sp. BT771]MDV6221550.1 SpvB/TcaC N-terminal domain-containing protein [Flavitalea sp. BT771]
MQADKRASTSPVEASGVSSPNPGKPGPLSASDSGFLRTDRGKSRSNAIEIPSISLPKGGGAIKGIDEKFNVNAVNGTASLSIPLPFSQARGISPQMALSYNSGAGNGVFGMGWDLDLPTIKRRTDDGLPHYIDAIDSDSFLLSQAEDLVPEYEKITHPDGTQSFKLDPKGDYITREAPSSDGAHTIRYHRPRIDMLYARIERWTEHATGIIRWRMMTKDNVTTLFGWTSQAVLSDPADSTGTRIFEWLPEFQFDDKGNCCHYIYKPEDASGFDHSLSHNRHRFANGHITYTNRYLAKVLYGNRTPYKKFGAPFPPAADYLFQTILDYGEYDPNPPYLPMKDWDFRPDAFSEYKSTFEIRTTRRCQKVLFFHFFDELPGGSALVKSVDLTYDSPLGDLSFLRSVTSTGYIKMANGAYTTRSMPSTEFTYQQIDWNKNVAAISTDDQVHAPAGLDEPDYLFTDLFNEGLSGVLTEQAGGWYYKYNLGDGHFTEATLVSPKPSFSGLGSHLTLTDLDGDGGRQLVNWATAPKGYFELDDNNEWQGLQNFQECPTIDISNTHARLLDLDGDGRPDLLLTEDAAFTWYRSLGRKGFAPADTAPRYFDEEKGPCLVFAEPLQTIFLADMSGDGLTDIVRIRNGEICYWPNLGFGKFGAKIAMDNAPLFDHPDSFNPAFLRLADLDGSGTTDIIYLGKNVFTCWLNRSGNDFNPLPFEIDAFPPIHREAKISVTDLLGNGVPCIVWSDALPAGNGHSIRYVDLMNGRKPHLMTAYKNNLGKEVSFTYTPSTKFYIADKLAGRPWITKLHFPVQCISRIDTVDRISGWTFVRSYQYHHGYYDHTEKEFRGFGMVEQTDAERSGDDDLQQAPVLSKTWFHTGAFLQRENILGQFAKEYWYEEMIRQGFVVVNHEHTLPDARITAGAGLTGLDIAAISVEEWRQALRACKSTPLRNEIFGLDAPPGGASMAQLQRQLTPYSVDTRNCNIELLQPKGKNKYAVFARKDSESIRYTYERNTDDPRISHELTIATDAYGNVLQSAAIVYPRLTPFPGLPPATAAAQAAVITLFTDQQYTNDLITTDTYRLRLASETRTFQIKGVLQNLPPGNIYTVADLTDILTKCDIAAYHELDREPNAAVPPASYRPLARLIEHTRITYYRNDLGGPLLLHHLESLALPFESYQLAYTPELLTDIFGPINVAGSKITDALMIEGKYTNSEGDGNWWVRSGRMQFIEGAETAADAQSRFFSPIAFIDPYQARTSVQYLGNYFLFIKEVKDHVGNSAATDRFNFRTLAPQRMRDINNNLSEVLTDELGMVKALALFGKGAEADDLTGLNDFTDAAETALISGFFNVPDTPAGIADSVQLTTRAQQLLQHATVRFVYDLDAYKNSGRPVVVASIAREQHFSQDHHSPVQLSFEYSGGMGQLIMKKMQARPGMAKAAHLNPDNTWSIAETDTSPQLRWIGNGRTILNNKGNPVKQYEPYFSVTFRYEDNKALVQMGVTAFMFYDALDRLVRTEMPDGTITRLAFDAWRHITYDANDTTLDPDCSWYLRRHGRLMDAELIAEGKDPVKEQAAADKSALHGGTPNVIHLDTLGRPILSIDHNRDLVTAADEFYPTSVTLDVESNLRQAIDARQLPENGNKGNTVMTYKYDMLGNLVQRQSMDAGQRWLLINIVGNPLRTWDERGHEFQFAYDILHRPTHGIIKGGDGPAPLDNIFDRIFYGEDLLLPGRTNEAALQADNLLGKTIRHFDTGGLKETPAFDFNGFPKTISRQLFSKYKETANWTDARLVPDLETPTFTFTNIMDALGRIVSQTAPDGSVITPSYDQGGRLNGEKVAHIAPAAVRTYIQDIQYNEKGQRTKIIYGNDVSSKFTYDKSSFRLIRMETKRLNADTLQDWRYTFDAIGNITHIEDRAIPVRFFDNVMVTGVSAYTYDALYRLREATGRENDVALAYGDCDNWNDKPFLRQMNPHDPLAMRNYTQTYQYDPVGNITEMKHVAPGGGWTRKYDYEKTSNRLAATHIRDNPGPQDYTKYKHHPRHGFLLELPHLESLGWNFKEELVLTSRQHCTDDNIPVTTYYQYDAGGRRLRKITENAAPAGGAPGLKEQRIYIEGYETYRTYNAGVADFVRDTLSLLDQGNRFVMVDTVKLNTRPAPDPADLAGTRLGRYQLHNHIGSAALELDDTPQANVLSYEEYHPFGTTAYQAYSAAIRTAARRYRYTGMERDEESGLSYHAARYYLPWLGRWLSADPIAIGDGINVYRYAKNNPVRLVDTDGRQSTPTAAPASISQPMVPPPPKMPPHTHKSSPKKTPPPVTNATPPPVQNAPPAQVPVQATPPPLVDPTLQSYLQPHRKDVVSDLPEVKAILDMVKNETIPADKLDTSVNNPMDDQHIRDVVKVVNWALKGAAGNTLDERWAHARLSVTTLRQSSDKTSESLILRDAQYYLWGTTYITEREKAIPVPNFFLEPYLAILPHDAYSAQKWFEMKTGIAGIGQATNHPYSALGGGFWYDLGVTSLLQNRSDENKDVTPPPLSVEGVKKSHDLSEKTNEQFWKALGTMAM